MLHNAIDELDYDHDELWCVPAHTRPNFPHVTCQSSMHHVPVARFAATPRPTIAQCGCGARFPNRDITERDAHLLTMSGDTVVVAQCAEPGGECVCKSVCVNAVRDES